MKREEIEMRVYINMKKCLTCILLCFILGLTACGKQENIEDKISGKVFTYENEGCGLGEGMGEDFSISINEDGTFTYCEGNLSSYIGYGKWTLDNEILTISEDERMAGVRRVNCFKVEGDNLVFQEEDSDNFMYVKVEDGEQFIGGAGQDIE